MRRRLSESTSLYSDGEGRYPIIAPIGPFIFCLHSRETAARADTNQIALCNNLQHWINHTNFTRTDRYFTSSSRVPFLSCSCPSATVLIYVMKYLISHTGATKRRLGGVYICLEIIKICRQHGVWGKSTTWPPQSLHHTQIHTQKLVQNVHLLSHVSVFNS